MSLKSSLFALLLVFVSCNKNESHSEILSNSKWVVTRYDIVQTNSSNTISDTITFSDASNYQLNGHSFKYSIGDYSKNDNYILRLEDFTTLNGTSSGTIAKVSLNGGVINGVKFTRSSDSEEFFVWMEKI